MANRPFDYEAAANLLADTANRTARTMPWVGIPAIVGKPIVTGAAQSAMNLAETTRRAMKGEVPDPGPTFADILNVALTGRAMPKPSASLGVFGGRLARTADLKALARAEAMEATGAPREQIWSDTGWFKGGDGKWRFEIDDSGAEVLSLPASDPYLGRVGGDAGPLNRILNHPKLIEAYPDLAELPTAIETQGGSGAYRPATMTIGEQIFASGETPAQLKGTLLHELQHAIQRREGFAHGGSPRNPELAAKTRDIAQQASNDFFALQNDLRAFQSRWVKEQGITEGDMDYTLWARMGAHEWRKRFPGKARRYDEAFEEMELRGGTPAYERLAGEVEARNVTHRADWDASKRTDIPPDFSQDVPFSKQIFVGSQ